MEAIAARLWAHLEHPLGQSAVKRKFTSFSPNVLNELTVVGFSVTGGQGDPMRWQQFATLRQWWRNHNQSLIIILVVSLSNAFTTMGDATGFTTRVDRNIELYDNG